MTALRRTRKAPAIETPEPRIRIIDPSERVVRTLDLGPRESGAHEIIEIAPDDGQP